jgi:hypothetical protein
MSTDYPFRTKFERARYSPLYLMAQLAEDRVQKEIIEFLHLYLVDVYAIDAGAKRLRGHLFHELRRRGTQFDERALAGAPLEGGLPAGFSDLEATLAPNGRALYIECKAPAWIAIDGRVMRSAQTADQKQLDFLFSKHQRGALVCIAWSVEDVIRATLPALERNRDALCGQETRCHASGIFPARTSARPRRAFPGAPSDARFLRTLVAV